MFDFTPRMGIHLCTETNVEDVPHCFTTEVPVYVLEVLNPLMEEWIFHSIVSLESLPKVVEEMHIGATHVRLLENGFPVFTVWNFNDE